MERNNTKQEILNAALDLFSTQGFDATSMSQIAEAVGVRKASLYSHFASKDDILKSLMQNVLETYEKHSIFANADFDNPEFIKGKQNITPDSLAKRIIEHIKFILHDPFVSKGRKMLTIGQFSNAEMAAMQTKHNYCDVMRFFTGLVKLLINQGKLKDGDEEIMAAELCLPITVWISLCDREPERETEVIGMVERHVKQFFEVYGK